jgi:hypothetical protein
VVCEFKVFSDFVERAEGGIDGNSTRTKRGVNVDRKFESRHSGACAARTRNLEIPGSSLRDAPE